jgi:hypothetical protein
MTAKELEIQLTERCISLDLKKKAFDNFEETLSNIEGNDPENNLSGFDKSEIKAVFNRFTFQVGREGVEGIIRTSIGLYDQKDLLNNWFDPIGYYDLDTDFNGDIVDDWFVIEREKYVKDIGIISHFQSMNEKLPLEYLKRNHVQYELVTYISLVGTLFVSKQFEGAGRCLKRAYTYLETTKNSKIDKDYLKMVRQFLKMMKKYLMEQDLLTQELKQELLNVDINKLNS